MSKPRDDAPIDLTRYANSPSWRPLLDLIEAITLYEVVQLPAPRDEKPAK